VFYLEKNLARSEAVLLLHTIAINSSKGLNGMKNAYMLLALLGILIGSSFINISAQSILEKQVVIEYETAIELQPIDTYLLEVGNHVHIVDIERTEDGSIFVLLFYLDYPQEFSLIQYVPNEGFTFIRNLSYVVSGIYSRDDRLMVVGINQWLIEMDFQGNITAQIQLQIGNQYMYVNRLVVGEDGSFYLIVSDIFNNEQHFMKLDDDGIIIWDEILGSLFSSYHSIEILPNGQSFIISNTHIESRTSNGTLLWKEELGDSRFWYSRSLSMLNDDSLYVLSSYAEGPMLTGRNILRFDTNGNLIWNTSIIGRHPPGSEADVQVNLLNIQEASIFGLLEITAAPLNPYLVEISHNGELLNLWAMETYLLEQEYLEFNTNGSPVIIGLNGTYNDERHLVALTYPQVILQPSNPWSGRTIGLVLILLGSACVVGVVVVFWRSKRE